MRVAWRLIIASLVAAGFTATLSGTAEAKTVWLCKPGIDDNPCETA